MLKTLSPDMQVEEQKRRAEADKLAAITALEQRSREFLREKEEKRRLEARIANMQSQLLTGGSKPEDTPVFRFAPPYVALCALSQCLMSVRIAWTLAVYTICALSQCLMSVRIAWTLAVYTIQLSALSVACTVATGVSITKPCILLSSGKKHVYLSGKQATELISYSFRPETGHQQVSGRPRSVAPVASGVSPLGANICA
jgi:hypothetical protein